MLSDFVFFISIVLSFFAADYFYCNILPLRPHIRHPFIACSLLNLIFIAFYLLSLKYPDISSIIYNLYIFLPVLLFFKGDILHRICAGFTAWTIIVLSESFANILFIIADMLSPNVTLAPVIFLAEKKALPMLFFTIVVAILQFSFCHKLSQILKHCFMNLRPTVLFQLGFIFWFSLFSQNICFTIASPKTLLMFVPFFLVITMLILAIFSHSFKSFEREVQFSFEIQMKNQYLKQQLDSFHKTYQEYQNIKKWNHDISNHLLALSYLIEAEKNTEAEQYINALLSNSYIKGNKGDK